MKYTPLRWSEVHRIDESEKDVFLGIKVIPYTLSLTPPELDPERVARLKLMSDQDVSYRRCSIGFTRWNYVHQEKLSTPQNCYRFQFISGNKDKKESETPIG